MPGMALQEGLHGVKDEWQDDPLRFGEIEGALERRLSGAAVAESIAGDSI